MIRMDMVYNVLSREQRLAILHIVPTDLKVILFFLFFGGGDRVSYNFLYTLNSLEVCSFCLHYQVLILQVFTTTNHLHSKVKDALLSSSQTISMASS